MITKEDLKKIEAHFQKCGIKDSQFNDAVLPLDGSEYITLLQQGRNVKMKLSTFVTIIRGGSIVPSEPGDNEEDAPINPPSDNPTFPDAPVITKHENGTVTISAKEGVIFYSIDDEEVNIPYIFSPLEVKALFLGVGSHTIRAKVVNNSTSSEIVTYNYTHAVEAPTIEVTTVNSNLGLVTITPPAAISGVSNEVIYYTTDGSDPTASNTASVYTRAFNVSNGTRIKAVYRYTVQAGSYYHFVNSKIREKVYESESVPEVLPSLPEGPDTPPKYYIGAGVYDSITNFISLYSNNTSAEGSVSSPLATIPTTDGVVIKCNNDYNIEVSLYDSTGAEYIQELSLVTSIMESTDGIITTWNYYMVDGFDQNGFKLVKVIYNKK